MEENYQAQKLIVYNRYLPYENCLRNEAASQLADIKYNLCRAVLFKELTPGVLVWCNRLDT